jgi:hypothetical protein
MIDGPPNGIPTFARLSKLLERRRAWSTLSWSQNASVQLSGPCHAYELVGGVFCKSMKNGPNSHFVACELPTRDHSGSQTVYEDVGLYARDFVIDPSQDLVAYVEGDEHPWVLQNVYCYLLNADVDTGS